MSVHPSLKDVRFKGHSRSRKKTVQWSQVFASARKKDRNTEEQRQRAFGEKIKDYSEDD